MVAAGFTPGEADALRRSMATWKRMGGIETPTPSFVDPRIHEGQALRRPGGPGGGGTSASRAEIEGSGRGAGLYGLRQGSRQQGGLAERNPPFEIRRHHRKAGYGAHEIYRFGSVFWAHV
jgi:hypothetical protein